MAGSHPRIDTGVNLGWRRERARSRPPAQDEAAPGWTGAPPGRYDPLVASLPPARRHVRPISTIRGALGAGFAVVFGLWVLSGYELIRSLNEVEQRVTEMQDAFQRGVQARATVRTNVLLGSIYLRDALIDSGAISREHYRREIQHIRGEIERLLDGELRRRVVELGKRDGFM